MADAPSPGDGTTGLTADLSHVSLGDFSSYTADPGPSHLSFQAAGAAGPDAYYPNSSDYHGSITQPAPPRGPNNPFVCDYPTSSGEICYSAHPRQCDLTKHQKIHTKPHRCKYCPERFAERKDRARHYNTHHPDSPEGKEARKKSKTMKNAKCPRCSYEGNGRADNVKRHMEKKGHK